MNLEYSGKASHILTIHQFNNPNENVENRNNNLMTISAFTPSVDI